jgi:hypothetical protein
MKIAIYDIDNTIFRSPEKPLGHQRGWWGKRASLEPPVVPQKPGKEWYNNAVISLLERDYADPDTVVLVMTGRLYFFQERLIEIFNASGSPALQKIAQSGEIVTNPGSQDTFRYKLSKVIEAVDEIVASGNTVDEITVYDDRESHVIDFSTEFEKLIYENLVSSYKSFLVSSTTPDGPPETISLFSHS